MSHFHFCFEAIRKRKLVCRLRKYGRYARNVLRKKGLIPAKEFMTNANLAMKSNGTTNSTGIKTLNNSMRHQQTVLIRTPEPARRSLTLANTRSPKSSTMHPNDRPLAGVSTSISPMTIHECDEGLAGNNLSDDEDEDRLSSKRSFFFESFKEY